MKKFLAILVLGLLWCNVGFAECIKGDCNNGRGTFTWENGDRYVGEFKDDQAHGQGIFTFVNGDEYVGEFKDGKLIKSKEKLMKKYDAFQSFDIEMNMKVAPSGFDFSCYNECKERNSESFCRQKCSMQLQ